MRSWIFLICLIIVIPCLAREVYRSTSEDGVTSYSDTYLPGAEKVSVATGSSSQTESESNPEASANQQHANSAGPYRTFQVAQPENNDTIRNDEGVVNVGLSLSPKLVDGHVIQIYLNGTKLDTDLTTTQFSLNALNRGTHSLQAKVVDVTGNTQISSQTVNFELRKAAVDNP
jgi:hypothetical protein